MIIGIKSGRFELLHRAHVETLEECANKCDRLIVLVHDCRTINKPSFLYAKDRKYIIEKLSFVWKVFIYTEDTENELVKSIVDSDRYVATGASTHYHIMFHSEELQGQENIPGARYVDEVKFIKRKQGSTSELVEKIKND